MNYAHQKKAELAQQGEILIKNLLDTLKVTGGKDPQAIMGLAYEFKSLLDDHAGLSNYGVISRLISSSGYIHTAWAHLVSGDMSLETGTLTFLRKEKSDDIRAVADILSSTIPIVTLAQLTYYAAFDECIMAKAVEGIITYASPSQISHNHGEDYSRFCLIMGMMNQQNAFTTLSEFANNYHTEPNHNFLVAQASFLLGISKSHNIAKRPKELSEQTRTFFDKHNALLCEVLKHKNYPLPRLEACLSAFEYGFHEWADTVIKEIDITRMTANIDSLTALERFGSIHLDHHLNNIKTYYRLNLRESPDDRNFESTIGTLLHFYLHTKENRLPIRDLMINRYNASEISKLAVDLSLIKDKNAISHISKHVNKDHLKNILVDAATYMKKPLDGWVNIEDLKPILINIDLYKRDVLSHDLSL